MSEKIPYESSDGAVGYITDVTNEDFYREPRIELYDGLEQDCFELVCDFAELIGVELDREEPDFRLANHVRDTVINLLEKEFGIPFPVHGESTAEREARLARAQEGFKELVSEFGESVPSLDEQISVASNAKEYELTLFQGKEDEKIVRAFLTEEQVLTICKGIAGKSSVGDCIQFPGGERIEICHIDAIEALDSDYLLPDRQVTHNNVER